MTELKKCPVCGETPETNWYQRDEYVNCKNPECMLEGAEFTRESWNADRQNHTEQPLEMVTLHDRYAMAALTGVLGKVGSRLTTESDVVELVMGIADECMKQRKARGGEV